MATYSLKDRVKVLTATSGTGALTVLGAVPKFQTLTQAGLVTGAAFAYLIEVPSGPWETGTAVIQSDGTLTRVLDDSSTKALLALTGEVGTTVSLTLTSASLSLIINATPGLPTTISSGTTYAMQTADRCVYVRKTTGSATAITLPSIPISNVDYLIKDAKGDAQTNPITVSGGTIDGQTSLILSMNYVSLSVRFNGVDWSIT